MAFLLLIVLPLTYLSFAFEYVAKKNWKPLIFSLVAMLICSPIYVWGVMQSRSSTAAIGLIFIPIFASSSGLLTLGFFYARSKAKLAFNFIAGLCVVGFLIICGFGIYAGLSEKKRNDQKDYMLNQIAEQSRWIAVEVRKHQGKENEWLKQQLEVHKNDLGFQVAAVRSAYLEDDTLKELAANTDNRDLLSTILIHKKVTPETIEAIFNKHGSEDKLDVAFSMNTNTPTAILDKIYSRSSYTDHWLASNLNTSKSTLRKIIGQKKISNLVQLSQRNDLDCAMLLEMQAILSDVKLTDFEGVRAETLNRVKNKVASGCANQ